MTTAQLLQMGISMPPAKIMEYVTNAANDPAFEQLFQQVSAGGGQGQLPAGGGQGN